jgi:hypothetical protein
MVPLLSTSVCPECGVNPRRAPGRRCAECHSAYMRDFRKSHGGEYSYTGNLAKAKSQIRSMIRSRISRGTLERLPCDRCGLKEADIYVVDYRKPLKSLKFRCKGCR